MIDPIIPIVIQLPPVVYGNTTLRDLYSLFLCIRIEAAELLASLQ